jgi:hypothetical protein
MLSAREATVGVGVIFDSQSGVVSGHEMHAYMKSAFRYLRLADIMTVNSQLLWGPAREGTNSRLCAPS